MIIKYLVVVIVELTLFHSAHTLQHSITKNQQQSHLQSCIIIKNHDSSGRIMVITIQDIEPYIEQKQLCFIIMRNTQNNDNQQTQRLYYLRVDYMPNQCLSIKNDIPFRKLSQRSAQQIHYIEETFLQKSQLMIAQVNITKQCAHLSSNSNQTQQTIKLIIEIRQVICEFFNFPLYKHPFTELLYLLVSIILIYIMVTFLQTKFNLFGFLVIE